MHALSVAAWLAPTQREVKREDGATAVEYALLVSMIAGVIFLAVAGLGTTTKGLFDGFESAFLAALPG